MTTKQFNQSVNADIRRMIAKSMDEYDPLLAAYNNGDGDQTNKAKPYAQQVCNGGDWPEAVTIPDSFEAWLKSNSDEIEMPLDRTESACQWFDEQGKLPF